MSTETGQRYLRGDQRSRRKRDRKGSTWVLLGLVALSGLAVGWTLARLGYDGLMGWSALALKKVVVEGAVRVDKQALEQRLEPLRGHNILTIDLKAIRRAVQAEPWVKDATVQRVFPDRVVIWLVERHPGAADGDTGELIDNAGVRIAGSRATREDRALPQIVGAADDQAVLRRAMALIATLADAETPLLDRIRAIDVSDTQDLKLVLNRSGCTVHLGSGEFVMRLNRYLNVEPLIAERFPTARSVDLRFDGRVVVAPVPGEADSEG